MADISIINEDTRFTDGHIRLGVAAGDHAVAIWPLLCGMAKAKYYLLTSDFIDGREAERIGLVARRCPPDEVLPEALRDRRAARHRPTRRDPADQAGAQPLAAPGAPELRGVARVRDAQLPRGRTRPRASPRCRRSGRPSSRDDHRTG